MKRCSESETRVEISRRLGESVDKICRKSGSIDLFENLMEDFADAADFMDYFRAIWCPRIGLSLLFSYRYCWFFCLFSNLTQ